MVLKERKLFNRWVIHAYCFLLRNLLRTDNRVFFCAVAVVLVVEGLLLVAVVAVVAVVADADVSSSFSNSTTCVEFVSSATFFRFDMKRNKDVDFTTVGEAGKDSSNVDPFVFVVAVKGGGSSLLVLASSSSEEEGDEGKTLLPRKQETILVSNSVIVDIIHARIAIIFKINDRINNRRRILILYITVMNFVHSNDIILNIVWIIAIEDNTVNLVIR
jgi:hypothetical protein